MPAIGLWKISSSGDRWIPGFYLVHSHLVSWQVIWYRDRPYRTMYPYDSRLKQDVDHMPKGSEIRHIHREASCWMCANDVIKYGLDEQLGDDNVLKVKSKRSIEI